MIRETLDAEARFRKARKVYRDFPFLWAVDPTCDFDLHITIKRLQGEEVSAMMVEDTQWWTHSRTQNLSEEVRLVRHTTSGNLARAVLDVVGVSHLFPPEILHLIAVTRTKGWVRNMVLHRPRRDGMTDISIRVVCASRAGGFAEP